MSPILKRQKEKYKMPSKYVLLILTSLCVLLMVITFMTNFMGGALNTISGYVVVPFQEGISEVGSFLTKKSEDLKELRTVMAENEKVKKEIEALTSENIKLRQDKYELESLRKLFKLDADYAEYEKTAARIISKDTGNWYSSFIVNKGSNDGIKLNMNVIADGGLVGIVTKVGDNWSRVTAVIDDTSNVSAMALSTNDKMDRGVVTISIPNFEYDYDSGNEIESVIKKFGINKVFDVEQWLIGDCTELDTVKIGQKTSVAVDKNGIEAAAVTKVEVAYIGKEKEKEEELVITFDRPFMYILMKEGVPLFIGTVYNPAE